MRWHLQRVIQYVQQEFQVDCKEGYMKNEMGDKAENVGCLHIVEDLEMEVEELVLNSLGKEEP